MRRFLVILGLVLGVAGVSSGAEWAQPLPHQGLPFVNAFTVSGCVEVPPRPDNDLILGQFVAVETFTAPGLITVPLCIGPVRQACLDQLEVGDYVVFTGLTRMQETGGPGLLTHLSYLFVTGFEEKGPCPQEILQQRAGLAAPKNDVTAEEKPNR